MSIAANEISQASQQETSARSDPIGTGRGELVYIAGRVGNANVCRGIVNPMPVLRTRKPFTLLQCGRYIISSAYGRED
jgi:hypothetical protein